MSLNTHVFRTPVLRRVKLTFTPKFMLELLLQGVQQPFQPIACVYEELLAQRQALNTAQPLLVLHESYFLRKKMGKYLGNTGVNCKLLFCPFPSHPHEHTETWKLCSYKDYKVWAFTGLNYSGKNGINFDMHYDLPEISSL